MQEYCTEPQKLATPAGKSPHPVMDLWLAVQSGMYVLACVFERAQLLPLSLPLSLSLISTSEGKELVINSFGFRIWVFSCERGRSHEDFVSSILCSVNIY